MGRFDDRLRRLEESLRHRGPTLEEVQHAWGRIAASARAKLRGELPDGEQAARDRDTVDRWARAEGADLDGDAEHARQKLVDVHPRRKV